MRLFLSVTSLIPTTSVQSGWKDSVIEGLEQMRTRIDTISVDRGIQCLPSSMRANDMKSVMDSVIKLGFLRYSPDFVKFMAKHVYGARKGMGNFADWLMRGKSSSSKEHSADDPMMDGAKGAAKSAIGSLNELIYIQKIFKDIGMTESELSIICWGVAAQWAEAIGMLAEMVKSKLVQNDAVNELIEEVNKKKSAINEGINQYLREHAAMKLPVVAESYLVQEGSLIRSSGAVQEAVSVDHVNIAENGAQHTQPLAEAKPVLASGDNALNIDSLPEHKSPSEKSPVQTEIKLFKLILDAYAAEWDDATYGKKAAKHIIPKATDFAPSVIEESASLSDPRTKKNVIEDIEQSKIMAALILGTKVDHQVDPKYAFLEKLCPDYHFDLSAEQGAWRRCKEHLGYKEPDDIEGIREVHALISDAENRINYAISQKIKTDSVDGLNVLYSYQQAEKEAAKYIGYFTSEKMKKFYNSWNPYYTSQYRSSVNRSFKFRFQLYTRVWYIRLKLVDWFKTVKSVDGESVDLDSLVTNGLPLTVTELAELISDSYALLLKQWALLKAKESVMKKRSSFDRVKTEISKVGKVVEGVVKKPIVLAENLVFGIINSTVLYPFKRIRIPYQKDPVILQKSEGTKMKEAFDDARFAFSAAEVLWFQSFRDYSRDHKLDSYTPSTMDFVPSPGLIDWSTDKAVAERERVQGSTKRLGAHGFLTFGLLAGSFFFPPAIFIAMFNVPNLLRESYRIQRRDAQFRKLKSKQIVQAKRKVQINRAASVTGFPPVN